MTDANGNGQHPPEPVERGRYAVYKGEDDSLMIARASGICQTCQDCGCGQQAEPIGPIPGQTAKAALLAGQGKFAEAMKLLMASGVPLPFPMMKGGRGPKAGRRG